MSTARIVVLAAVALMVLCGTAFGVSQGLRAEHRSTVVLSEDVERIEVRSESGDVTVRAGLTPSVIVDRRERWLLDRPRLRHRMRGDTLVIETTCGEFGALADCRADLEIAAPHELDVLVRSDAGRVVLRGLSGRVDVVAESGDIEARRMEPVVLRAHTDGGDVTLDILGAPTRLDARTAAGDVRVVVPFGAYRVDAQSESGNVRVAGLLRDDLAPQRIEAVTDAGDVLVRAR